MKNIITSFAFLIMLGFYGNATANMITMTLSVESGTTNYHDIEGFIGPFITENINAPDKATKKVAKKVSKQQSKHDKILAKRALDLSVKKQAKLERKQEKYEYRIVALLAGQSFSYQVQEVTSGGSTPPPPPSASGGSTPPPPPSASGGSTPPPPPSGYGGGENMSEQSVPEPSTIALLGLGLVGLGVARRFKRTA